MAAKVLPQTTADQAQGPSHQAVAVNLARLTQVRRDLVHLAVVAEAGVAAKLRINNQEPPATASSSVSAAHIWMQKAISVYVLMGQRQIFH